MTDQIIDIDGQPHLPSNQPKSWYRWYCNECHRRGKTTLKSFECHPGRTRITIDDGGDE